MNSKDATITEIPVESLNATDLREEAVGLLDAIAYGISLDGQAEAAEALWVPSAGRIGIAWGAEAVWSDAQSAEEGIELWVTDSEAFAARW